MHGVKGTRSVGNVSKGERPTHYAKGGQYGNMLAKPCPCIMNKGKLSIRKSPAAIKRGA